MLNKLNEKSENRSVELTCRLCLTERKHSQPLFVEQLLVEWIRGLTSLKIEHIQNAPASLCLECKTSLESFESFRAMCLSNDNIFHDTYVQTTIQNEMVEILHIEEEPDEASQDHEALNMKIVEVQDEILNNSHDMVVEIEENEAIIDEPDAYEVLYLDTASGSPLRRSHGALEENLSSQAEQKPGETNGKKFCEICNKYVNRLTQHQLIHKEVRPFQCTYCSKGFNQLCNLKKHVRIHTKEKPYLCSECDKGFTNSTELKIHMRIHTQERPFECTECGKSFVTSGHLVRHARSHSGSKPYECNVCKAKFSTSSHLVRHKRIHSMEKRYECVSCAERFMRKENLRAHKCRMVDNKKK
ncbi:RB-associated KRAB zinc finger protein-like [Armigeres subalbatus]|uniref:RB-associated KRAB zinc finger protein-like n=1 Tax=Armigeres subalbatus TaxID=124917 RepID=UPI002ED3F393